MKKTILTCVGLVLAGVIGFTVAWRNGRTVPQPDTVLPPLREQTAEIRPPATEAAVTPPRDQQPIEPSGKPAGLATRATPPVAPTETKPAQPPAPLVFNQAVETLTSPQASFPERQAAWKQLKDTGRLDQAITELEQRAAANPTAPECPAALGQAYLQKANAIRDMREQGILGMKADQTFDAALQLDPNNWDARFWKAAAMSHWPAMLGKGNEVVQQFAALITQQEAQSPQPHFAQTYALLGDHYQRLGHADYAHQIWRRGAGLFPDDSSLKGKLAGQP